MNDDRDGLFVIDKQEWFVWRQGLVEIYYV